MFFRKIFLTLFIFTIFCSRADAIKIGLQTNAKNVKIASSVSANVYDGIRNSYIYEFKPMKVGEPYVFEMDYYWMMGDNRHKSADSRYWGFVPEDHIVGSPMFVWLSIEKDNPWGKGHIRWKRLGLSHFE